MTPDTDNSYLPTILLRRSSRREFLLFPFLLTVGFVAAACTPDGAPVGGQSIDSNQLDNVLNAAPTLFKNDQNSQLRKVISLRLNREFRRIDEQQLYIYYSGNLILPIQSFKRMNAAVDMLTTYFEDGTNPINQQTIIIVPSNEFAGPGFIDYSGGQSSYIILPINTEVNIFTDESTQIKFWTAIAEARVPAVINNGDQATSYDTDFPDSVPTLNENQREHLHFGIVMTAIALNGNRRSEDVYNSYIEMANRYFGEGGYDPIQFSNLFKRVLKTYHEVM